MKKTCLTACTLLFLVISAQAQNWNAVNIPIEENINGICFVNPDTAYIITKQGKMIRTFDAFKSIDTFEPTPEIILEDVEFINSDIGFICGSKGTFMRTTDGGYTFTSFNLTDTIPWFFDIEMFDDQHGMVIGMTRETESPYGGLAYRTEDGGKSWKKVDPIGLGYAELAYANGTVYLVSFGRINFSKDFGKTWKGYSTGEGSPGRSLSGLGNTVVIAGLEGYVYYSHDNCKSWYPSRQDPMTMFIATQMINSKEAYIGGSRQTLMKSSDGGRSWTRELMAKAFDVFDIEFIGDKVYVVGSEGGIIWKKVK